MPCFGAESLWAQGHHASTKASLLINARNVYDKIQGLLIGHSDGTVKEVAHRVDGPARADNDADVVEGSLHSFGAAISVSASLTDEIVEEDEGPATHTNRAADRGVDLTSLACIPKASM